MRGEKSRKARVKSFVMPTSKRLLSAFVVMANVGCAATTSASRAVEPTTASAPRAAPAMAVALAQSPQPVAEAPALPPSNRDRMLRAEQEAAAGARRVLTTARTLIDDEVVIRGTCYTWLAAVYRQAGGRFTTAFSGDRRGRYATAEQLQPGDWIHFINHSYGNGTHSAIFIGWTDRGSSIALTASYPGERREVPGRYREYELTSVYRIDRMRE